MRCTPMDGKEFIFIACPTRLAHVHNHRPVLWHILRADDVHLGEEGPHRCSCDASNYTVQNLVLRHTVRVGRGR